MMASRPAPHRRTRQRTAVASVLSGCEEFRTAQEVHELLRRRGEQVGLATVYRNLQAMAETGEADVVRLPDGQAAYRHCGQSTHHHHHLICRRCGRTVEVQFGDLEERVLAVAREQGFREVGHELKLYGLCSDC